MSTNTTPTTKIGASKLNRELAVYMLEIIEENDYGYEINTTAMVERSTALKLLDENKAKLFINT
jgi:hypothetical protein